ncbi:MAG TPA: hypothetical protein VFH56_04295 [Acidimicrobiales bacterium]|nr:hypothetical protein [Acidimicrobiales bacterium]
MHEVERDLAAGQRVLQGRRVGHVYRATVGAGNLGGTTREREDVVLGLDERNGKSPPDEPVRPHHRDPHRSTLHHPPRTRSPG